MKEFPKIKKIRDDIAFNIQSACDGIETLQALSGEMNSDVFMDHVVYNTFVELAEGLEKTKLIMIGLVEVNKEALEKVAKGYSHD